MEGSDIVAIEYVMKELNMVFKTAAFGHSATSPKFQLP